MEADGGKVVTLPHQQAMTPSSSAWRRRAAIQKLRTDLASAERECAKWKAASEVRAFELAELRAEMERRDQNENRNCLNWGPCSRHDGHMEDVSQ